MSTMTAVTDRPPLPPFTRQTAAQKVQAAEDAWNTCDPERVSLAYSEGSVWRNRDAFLTGRAEIVAFLTSKWERELEYALRKNLWSWGENRIAVRFQYECHDRDGQWWRSYGNELWEFDEHGLMTRREGSINDIRIDERDRRIFGHRPATEAREDLPVHMSHSWPALRPEPALDTASASSGRRRSSRSGSPRRSRVARRAAVSSDAPA
jgi:nuclear transport factor 2 (NTF2) superfamily protein